MRFALLVLLLSAQTLVAASSPRDIAEKARAWRSSHEREIVAELSAFVELPNIASNVSDIEKNAAALAAMLERRGIRAQLLRIEGAPPLVIGELRAPRAKRTISYYAHYDGQPVDPAKWTTSPWTPTMLRVDGQPADTAAEAFDPEWRLQARSASDDKGAIVAMLAAIDAMRAQKRTPLSNIRFVFDGEEEVGSPHLAEYFQRYHATLKSDFWIISDGPVHQSRAMQLLFGVRGIADMQMTVYGPVRPLHSGHYGNWAPNPISMLTRLVAAMRDDYGTILIPHFYDDVLPLTASERSAVEAAPRVENALASELAIGSTETSSLYHAILRPALNLRGISGGATGPATSNIISPEATASIDFRLVPKQTPECLRALVEAFIASRGYHIVRETPDLETRRAHPRVIKIAWNPGEYPSARTDLALPLAQRLITLVNAMGKKPIVLPSLGGSVPMHHFPAPAVIVPIANHDNNQHAANENIRLQNLWDGVELFTVLFIALE